MRTPEDIELIADEIFKSDLGRQLDIIYSTSDGRFFIRPQEAYLHTKGFLDKDTKPLEDKTIIAHYNPY